MTARFEQQISGYARRHEVPLGMTGLAQINGRYHTDAEYKLGYDLQYLVNWSPVLDVEILLRTTSAVLARRDLASACVPTTGRRGATRGCR